MSLGCCTVCPALLPPQPVSSVRANCSAPCRQAGGWRTTRSWACTGEVPEVAHPQGGSCWEPWWCASPWWERAALPHGANVALAKLSIASFLATPRPVWSLLHPSLCHTQTEAPRGLTQQFRRHSLLHLPACLAQRTSWEVEERACLRRQGAQPGGGNPA